MKSLQNSIENIVMNAGGEWAVVVEDLDKEKMIDINSNIQFPAKSLIKVPIMAALFATYERRKIILSNYLTLKREDIVKGSGILQLLSPGTQLTIYDLMTLMIVQSDNTATNILIDLIGFEEVENFMQSIGMEDSCLKKKLMIYPVQNEFDNENYITASDISLLFRKLATGKVISLYSSQQMISILKQQQIRNGIPAYLPNSKSTIIGVQPKWELANKTGWDSEHQHDAGILYAGQRSMAISVLSKNADSTKALDAIANIRKEVYQTMI
ncbi:serine hydrolase [Virgibacillus sp. JSM 102003]|uniref:serine hydrolase n=1 Tax=Virgibacillus sp. JSM 102003 TaxID=1562108 RepID=UPI0035C1CC5A